MRTVLAALLLLGASFPSRAALVTKYVKAEEGFAKTEDALQESVARFKEDRVLVSLVLAPAEGEVLFAGAYPDQHAAKLRAALTDPERRVRATLKYRDDGHMSLSQVVLETAQEELEKKGAYEYEGSGGPFFKGACEKLRDALLKSGGPSVRVVSALCVPSGRYEKTSEEPGYLLAVKVRLLGTPKP